MFQETLERELQQQEKQYRREEWVDKSRCESNRKKKTKQNLHFEH